MTDPTAQPPVGRFAPSPTGPLHFGSLIAALGSWMSVRSRGGTWRLRIDDLDSARNIAGMADTICRQLEALGLTWDGPVVYQSERLDAYAHALERLRADGALYPCSCSRREISRDAVRGPLGAVYRGTCRERGPIPGRETALRLRLAPGIHTIADRWVGDWTLHHDRIGDVALRRRNATPAYHLVTTVDDAWLGVTEVVRGRDLLAASVIQQQIQRHLALPAVAWAHLPLVLAADGRDKLSKQTGAESIDTQGEPLDRLLEAWRLLGQSAPPERPPDAAAFLTWARQRWSERSVPPGPLAREAQPCDSNAAAPSD